MRCDPALLLHAIESAQRPLPGGDDEPCFHFDDIADDLEGLREEDNSLDEGTALGIDRIVKRIRDHDRELSKTLDFLAIELDVSYLVVPPSQFWRYEPYPWPGAPAAPLLSID